MQHFCTGVLAGCLLSLFLPLPPAFFQYIFLAAFLVSCRFRLFFLAGCSAFIVSWHWQLSAYWQAQNTLLNSASSYHDVRIVSWTDHGTGDLTVKLQLQQSSYDQYLLSVRWRQAPSLENNQLWRLPLKLRPVAQSWTPQSRPRSLQALLQGVIGEGYVLPEQPVILLQAPVSARETIITQLKTSTASLSSAPLLLALTVAERQFDAQLWQGIRHSGLGHILTISGLHLGLVYGWSLLLFSGVLRLSPWRFKVELALLLSLLPVLGYGWLAGFTIPTLRAAVALAIFVLSRLLLRPLAKHQAWLLLLALLLLTNPLWLLSYSFWLSMLAVGCIVLLLWCLAPAAPQRWAKLRYWLLFQLALTLLMSFISMAFFSGVSVLSILSNLLFVPWCSLLAIPFLLITVCWSLAGLPYVQWLWQLTDALFIPLMTWLEWSASQAVWWSLPKLSPLTALLLAGALALLLACRVKGSLWLLWLTVVVLMVYLPVNVHPQLQLIDSGQRTVLLLQQPHNAILYLDAPATQLEGLVRQQVLPLLQQQRLRQLGPVIIPALEREMAPAVALIQQAYPMAKFYSAVATLPEVQTCSQLVAAYPDIGFRHWLLAKTDPCVLSVNMAGWQLLLPGKLQQAQERALLQQYADLTADIYLLADYGRANANSLAFLQALVPRQLLLAANAQGPYTYPQAAVQQRINLLNLPLYHTGLQGSLQIEFTAEKLRIRQENREKHYPWAEKPTAIAETSASTR
ncbi:ComEC/Rec2 family competence protein [Rheinheimera sp. UJ63]|uniref:ComEC/Rec2 family competence protein n=1 Tax=Rheinheimera sp. UJ63 TaxID=2910157 RepID=UPI001F1CE4B7|nr:ComEC/Rec2 family competence protein [Rheinheimera sp. UJ63]MCF4009424.1 ComEC/Rec2 family competence protein [Rheinheimera sp. UJ63]